ncbi:MFS transporter [Puia sp.]|jgi:ACS family hexuronate transporter-like MFS transporter|uniref:MFS transporter n=1 Tax=Puia sp. TaxID=2045100 RepID=UPI002F3EAD37
MKGISQGPQTSNMRWVMIGLAFLATVLNYVHRLAFNYLSAAGDLRKLIPDDVFGYLGTVFFIAYMISNVVSGYVIDRLGTRLGYICCMLFWTTAGLFHAIARTPWQFGICRFMLGFGEAGNWPAGLKVASEWFRPHERSTASGIFNSGSALGAIIVPPLVAFMGSRYGWQSTFVILSIFGYVWVILYRLVYYTPASAAPQEVRERPISPLRLIRTRFVATFLLAKIFLEPVWYFVTFWLGRYLVDVYHWDLKKIGLYAVLPFLIADIGNIAGGYFTQHIIRRGMPVPRARKLALGLSGGLMALALLAGPFLITSAVSALIVFGIAGFGYTSYTANCLALPADVVPKNSAASAWGLACIGNGLGGAIFQSASGITLKTLSVTHGYTMAYNVLFIAFGISALIGVAIFLFAMGPIVKDETLIRNPHPSIH